MPANHLAGQGKPFRQASGQKESTKRLYAASKGPETGAAMPGCKGVKIMEQLQQLIGIRDAAEKRLEDARAALERSPDAKLVASLTLLIDDLRKSFEADAAGDVAVAPAEEAPVQEAPVENVPAEETPVESNSAVQRGEEANEADLEPAEVAPASEEFSLEDSLEAELMAVDKDS